MSKNWLPRPLKQFVAHSSTIDGLSIKWDYIVWYWHSQEKSHCKLWKSYTLWRHGSRHSTSRDFWHRHLSLKSINLSLEPYHASSITLDENSNAIVGFPVNVDSNHSTPHSLSFIITITASWQVFHGICLPHPTDPKPRPLSPWSFLIKDTFAHTS